MLSLVNQEQIETAAMEKQLLMNKIVAAGLNSLSSYTNNNSSAAEKQLLETFTEKSFDVILSCWPLLDDRIKFFVFKHYVSDFENYMRGKIDNSNV